MFIEDAVTFKEIGPPDASKLFESSFSKAAKNNEALQDKVFHKFDHIESMEYAYLYFHFLFIYK